jgi:hypothetical protein
MRIGMNIRAALTSTGERMLSRVHDRYERMQAMGRVIVAVAKLSGLGPVDVRPGRIRQKALKRAYSKLCTWLLETAVRGLACPLSRIRPSSY